MNLLTIDADLRCAHELGRVQIVARQHWVRINRRSILVERDPEARPISSCPNQGPAIKPCTATLKVRKGYSDLIRIDHHRVCLDTVEGWTDGTPPGAVRYRVRHSGQTWVRQAQ